MALARRCAVCGGPLEGRGPRAKTCSDRCRSARARARRQANLDDEARAAEREIRDIVAREAPDVVTRVMKQELTPIVREAIDDDVLRAIRGMVGLTTKAVEALEEDLRSEDAVLRQRAYSLVIKYTVGHPALVKPDDKAQDRLQVIFNLPRPDGGPEPVDVEVADPDGDGQEKVCDVCGQAKPLSAFVAGSDRCQPCFVDLNMRVRKDLGI